MKLESLKMNLQSLKSRVNNQKGLFSNEKTAKSPMTFRKNKPNVKIGNINISSLITSKYAKIAKNQSSIINNHLKSKPNQTQYKPKTNPIPERQKMNTNSIITMNYINFPGLQAKKQTQTNPKQTQFRNYSGIQSSHGRLLIDRMKLKQLQKDFPDFFPETSRYGIDCNRQITYITGFNISPVRVGLQ